MNTPTPSFRMQRVERMLQKRLAEIIQKELRDPHLDMVNVSHIDVSKDLSHAVVYITTLSDDKEVQDRSVKILNKAAHILRHSLAKESTWRSFPALRFKYDVAFARSLRLVSLLQNIEKK
ncbi:MAG: 30S ribosome-binding factor RbfA [Gammaproteobacteria bacterium]